MYENLKLLIYMVWISDNLTKQKTVTQGNENLRSQKRKVDRDFTFSLGNIIRVILSNYIFFLL